MGYDVFISHSSKDKEVADAVCAALETSGIRCWMAPRDIKPGASWAASILFGINQSRLMALVFSSHANESKHVCREVERAVHRDIPVVPLRIEDVMPQGDLEYFLSMSHWMDALTSPLEKHLRVFVQNVQEQLDALAASAIPASSAAPAPAAPRTAARNEDRQRWAERIGSLPKPTLSDVLLPAWIAARERFQNAGSGNEADVRAKLNQLGEQLGAFEHDLDAQSAGLGPALEAPAAAKRSDLLLQAVDAVKASPSSAEFPDEARSALGMQFSEWVRANDLLESARTDVRQHRFDTALEQLDELKGLGSDRALREEADELRVEIHKAQQSQSNLRHAIQSAIHDKHWLKAWKKIDALDRQTGRKETDLRDQIVNGVVDTAETKGDSRIWKVAIDLLTQFGRLGDASLREKIVANLLKAAGSKADGDAIARQEALELLNQLDRVSKGNVGSADLRRQIEGKHYYEDAAARIKAGAFKEAVDSYGKAGERSCPGAAERLRIARSLAAADTLLKDDQATVEQLESALNSFGASQAFDPEEQAQATALSKKIQSILAGKKAGQAQSNLRNAIQAAINGERWLEAWNAVDALDEQTGGKETHLRDEIVNGVLSTAEMRGDCATWKVAIDLLTLFGRLWDGDRGAALLRETIVADLLKAAASKADGDASTRQEALELLSQLDRISRGNVKSAELRRQIEGKGYYEYAAARIRAGAFKEAVDSYGKAGERSCPGAAERLQIARAFAAADALLKDDRAAVEQLETALKSLGATPTFSADEQAQASGLRDKIQSVLAGKRALQAQRELLKAVQAAIDSKQWAEAWHNVDALDKQTGRKETQLRDQIVNDVVSTAEARGDSGTWKVAIDLLTQFGRLGDAEKGAAPLRERIVADLLKAAGSKADGDATTRQEALNLLSQLDRVVNDNVKAAELRRQVDGKGYNENAAAKIREGAFQEAADQYQKASERSYPGSRERLQLARALAAADALLNNDKATAEQLEPVLKSLGPTQAFNPDEQAHASALSKKIQSVLARKKAQQAQSDLRSAIQAAVEGKRWSEAWKTVDALDQQTGGKETRLREEIVNGVVSAAETKGDSGTWKVAIDLLTHFGRLGGGDKGAVSLRERIVADLLKWAGSKADGDAAARQEALDLLSQVDRVSKENVQAVNLRRQIEGKGYYENATTRIKAGAFQEAADYYQKASERSYPGSRERLQAARVLAAADALLNNDKAVVEQLEPALKSLGPTQAFNPDEQPHASALSKKIQTVLVRKKAQQAEGDLRTAIQAAVNDKQWLESWNKVDALDQQTGRKETHLRDQIVNGVVDTAETKGDSVTWKIAVDLLTQFGRLGDGDERAAPLREKIVADLLKSAGSKAGGDATARQETLDLLSQVDRISKENVQALNLRRQIEGKGYYENAAPRIRAGAFQEAADDYQKASERSCPGAAERLRVTRLLADADALWNDDKAGVEQLKTALASLETTQAFTPDEQAHARGLSEKIQTVLARKKAQQAEGDLRSAIQAAVNRKQWSEAWKGVDALDQQTGGKETQLRDQIVNGVVSTAETKEDSGTWKVAIDLLTQFDRLGDGDKGAASLREKIVADLLKSAGSKADGDATTRQETLDLLSHVDRVSKGNVQALNLRRQIEGKGYYENAAAKLRAGAFLEAADNYLKASERSCPGAAERLRVARLLADADALLNNDKAGVEQLETALKGLGPTQAFNPDEQAPASALSKKIQTVLARKKARQAESDLRSAIQAAVNEKQWSEAWKGVDALDQQTGGNETRLRENIVDGLVNTAETKGASGTWKVAIDLLTRFGRLGDGDKDTAALREKIVADLLNSAGSKADGDATTRQEALSLLSQLDRVSKGNVRALNLRRQIEGKGYYENAAARLKAGAFLEAVDNYQKASERFCPGAADRLRVARLLADADALLNDRKAVPPQLELAAASLAPTPAFSADERAQATALTDKVRGVLALESARGAFERNDAETCLKLLDDLKRFDAGAAVRKQAEKLREEAVKAQGWQRELRTAIQRAVEGQRWVEAWKNVEVLDRQTGGKETHLRETIIQAVVGAAEANGDSRTWKDAIDLLTQSGRLSGGGAGSTQATIVADLLQAARSRADGDASTRQEALNLLGQLDRVAKGNPEADDLRKQLANKANYDDAPGRANEGPPRPWKDEEPKRQVRTAGEAPRQDKGALAISPPPQPLTVKQTVPVAQQQSAPRSAGPSSRVRTSSPPSRRGRKLVGTAAAVVALAAGGLVYRNYRSPATIVIPAVPPVYHPVTIPTPPGRSTVEPAGKVPTTSPTDIHEQWARSIDKIQTPPVLSGDLLSAWTDARTRYRNQPAGNEADASAALAQLAADLGGFAQTLDAQSKVLNAADSTLVSNKRQEMFRLAGDAVKASTSGSVFPQDRRSLLEAQFSEWVRQVNVLEWARAALSQHQLDTAQAKLDSLKGAGDSAVLELAQQIGVEIKNARRQQQGSLRETILAQIQGKQWPQAWTNVSALEQQTGTAKETQLRQQIVDGIINAADTKADASTWQGAIDLLTQFGCLSTAGAGSPQEKVTADLLKAAGSKADAEPAEALDLLKQLDRVSKGNADADQLWRQITGKMVRGGRLQDAVDAYRLASGLGHPGAAERLQAVLVLAAADKLWSNDKATVDQLESALKTLGPDNRAFNNDEHTQAGVVSQKIQSALAAKYFELADGQEKATPANFAAAVSYYQKSAANGKQEASLRQKAAQQMLDVQKMSGLAAIRKIDEMQPSLNEAERAIAASMRGQLTTSLFDSAQKSDKEGKYDDAILHYLDLLAAQKDYSATPPISQRLDNDRLALAKKAYDNKKWQDALQQVNGIQNSSALAKDATGLRQQIIAAAINAGMEAYSKEKYLEARDNFAVAASDGNVQAMLRLAWIYRDGVTGVPADRVKAESFSRSAAQAGDPDAMKFLADLLSGRDRGVAQWTDEAEKWYLKALAAQPTDIKTMLAMGDMYRHANRIDPARDMYQRAANLKSIPAMLALAELAPDTATARPLYQAVLDLDKNNAEASKWMKDHPPASPPPAPPQPKPNPGVGSGIIPS